MPLGSLSRSPSVLPCLSCFASTVLLPSSLLITPSLSPRAGKERFACVRARDRVALGEATVSGNICASSMAVKIISGSGEPRGLRLDLATSENERSGGGVLVSVLDSAMSEKEDVGGVASCDSVTVIPEKVIGGGVVVSSLDVTGIVYVLISGSAAWLFIIGVSLIDNWRPTGELRELTVTGDSDSRVA